MQPLILTALGSIVFLFVLEAALRIWASMRGPREWNRPLTPSDWLPAARPGLRIAARSPMPMALPTGCRRTDPSPEARKPHSVRLPVADRAAGRSPASRPPRPAAALARSRPRTVPTPDMEAEREPEAETELAIETP